MWYTSRCCAVVLYYNCRIYICIYVCGCLRIPLMPTYVAILPSYFFAIQHSTSCSIAAGSAIQSSSTYCNTAGLCVLTCTSSTVNSNKKTEYVFFFFFSGATFFFSFHRSLRLYECHIDYSSISMNSTFLYNNIGHMAVLISRVV